MTRMLQVSPLHAHGWLGFSGKADIHVGTCRTRPRWVAEGAFINPELCKEFRPLIRLPFSFAYVTAISQA
jgi:hypothetical protein